MKCQKCNKNEANVQYREIINGRSREICLCSECAKETGILNRADSMFYEMEREMMQAFALPFGGSVFSGPSLFGNSFFALPETEAPQKYVKEQEAAFPSEPVAASAEDELKSKLLDAIAEERYEDAAKLRDKIKQLKNEK